MSSSNITKKSMPKLSQSKVPEEEDKPGKGKKGKKEMNQSKKTKLTGIKVRVKLPPIESYEKEVEFRAEGSGRVIVRLERLMGSDRVRLTDPKWMATLLESLEEEENNGWKVRTRKRKKDERQRSRGLAIEGFMEPDAQDLDLYNHPVFRVNRVLKKLAIYDKTMGVGQIHNLPPIIQVEPFENDENGAVFKTYPHHTEIHFDDESKTGNKLEAGEEEEGAEESVIIRPSQYSKLGSPPMGDEEEYAFLRNQEYGGEGGEGGETEGDEEEEEEENVSSAGSSLTKIQKNYGISKEEDLTQWQGFRSNLMDLLYADELNTVSQLYEYSAAAISVYEREMMTVDEFVRKLNRMMGQSGGGAM